MTSQALKELEMALLEVARQLARAIANDGQLYTASDVTVTVNPSTSANIH